jgi:hypothetical protein
MTSGAAGPDRRAALGEMFGATLALAGMAHAGVAQSAPAPDPGSKWLRLVADLSGRPVVSVLRGDVWGFLPQGDDLTTETFARRLYGYWALAVRQAQRGADGSVTLKTKAWSFYLDAVSGAVVTQMRNPYTGATVASRPLSGPASTRTFPNTSAATEGAEVTLRRLGDQAIVDVARISRFKTPDITWFKLEADFTTFACQAAHLEDAGRTHVPSLLSHNLVAEWQTWMNMHGSPGHILFRGTGAPIGGLAATPPELRAAIQKHFPGTLAEVEGWAGSR